MEAAPKAYKDALQEWEQGDRELWANPLDDIEKTAIELMTRSHERNGDSDHAHVTHEVGRRLVSARYTFDRSMECGYRELKRMLDGKKDRYDPTGVESNLSVLYAEACYSQLWRIIERSSRGDKPWADAVPQLSNFEPVGVRNSRNNNFEHAPHDQTDLGKFVFFEGVYMLPDNESGNWTDPGLIANVTDFAEDLSSRLQSAILAIT